MEREGELTALKRLAPFGIGAVLALALWLLYGELRHYNIHVSRRQLQATPGGR